MNDSEAAPQASPEEGDVGFVEYQDFVSHEPFHFESGGTIPELTLRYETYGHLNAAKDNAILICMRSVEIITVQGCTVWMSVSRAGGILPLGQASRLIRRAILSFVQIHWVAVLARLVRIQSTQKLASAID